MSAAVKVLIPTRLSNTVFLSKAALLQTRRGASNLLHGLRRFPQADRGGFAHILASSSTQLWTDANPGEAWYQQGKIQNLRLAAGHLNGCVIPGGGVFSFWKQVGRASAYKGYAPGRMLQEGCMIPAIGGGLCQLSNAIYQVALDAGCEIVERHPHSRVVPGSATAAGRDATIAWNYIDLRFRPKMAMQLRVVMSTTELRVSLHAQEAVEVGESKGLKPGPLQVRGIFADHACESCGNAVCFRYGDSPVQLGRHSRTAYLADSAWPEFREYVQSIHTDRDVLAVPLDGNRWQRSQYAWQTEGFSAVHTATLTTLLRGLRSRRLAAQGAGRQRAILDGAEALAKQFGRCLSADVDEVCVSQSLLPFLWRSGALGGRRLRVLMTQMPMRQVEAILDRGSELHPESATLKDFRAERWLVDEEEEALSNATEIATPHAQIASLFRSKAVLLDWSVTQQAFIDRRIGTGLKPTIFFPASTLGRKGAYELREALRGQEVRLLLGGKVLEDRQFWAGFDVAEAFDGSLALADLVVLPSLVESQPRLLLRSLAAGIPCITTAESGVHRDCGAIFVPVMNADALRDAILSEFARANSC